MNISAIGSSASSAADFAALHKQIFQKADTNADRSLTQDELTAAMKNAPKPPGAGRDDLPDSTKAFKTLDANSDGKVTESEMEAGSGKMEGKSKSGARPPGGAPPSGGSGKAKGSDEQSSSNKVYDKKDANEDGKVSTEEEFAYLLKHPESAKKDATQVAANKQPNQDGTGQVLNTTA